MQRKHPPDELLIHLENRIEEILLVSYLLGFLHVEEKVLQKINFADFSYSYAVEDLANRTSLDPEEYKQLKDSLKVANFTVSRLTAYDAIGRVKKKLLSAIPEGMTIQQFIREIGEDEVIKAAGFHTTNPWYWETVFRTNVQSAYMAGRFRAIEKYAEHIPYLEYVAILDERTTPICEHYHGIIRPVSDPIWNEISPPNHFNCRSVVRPVTRHEAETEKTRITPDDEIEKLPKPQEGFRSNPWYEWTAFKIPKDLQERLEKYDLLEKAEEVAQKARKSQAALTDAKLKQRILSSETTKKLFGSEAYQHVTHVAWSSTAKLRGYYQPDFEKPLIRYSTVYLKPGWEGIKQLETGAIKISDLSQKAKGAILGTTRTFLHELLHATGDIDDLRTYVKLSALKNHYRGLTEVLTQLASQEYAADFARVMGWHNTAALIESITPEDFIISGYDEAMFVLRRMLQKAAKYTGETTKSYLKPLVTRIQYRPQEVFGQILLDYLRATASSTIEKQINKLILRHSKDVVTDTLVSLLRDYGIAHSYKGETYLKLEKMLRDKKKVKALIDDLSANLKLLESY